MNRTRFVACLLGTAALALVGVLAGCSSGSETQLPVSGSSEVTLFPEPGELLVTSLTIDNGGDIPRDMVCRERGGFNASPQLSWMGRPDGTETFAIIMEDEDPPCGKDDEACVHWTIYNIPGERTVLGMNEGSDEIRGADQGFNYTGGSGYAGPCASSRHTYRITVYAMDRFIPALHDNPVAMTRSQFVAKYGGFILGSDTVEAVYVPE